MVKKNDTHETRSEVLPDTEHEKMGTSSSTTAIPSKSKDEVDQGSKSSHLRVLLVSFVILSGIIGVSLGIGLSKDNENSSVATSPSGATSPPVAPSPSISEEEEDEDTCKGAGDGLVVFKCIGPYQQDGTFWATFCLCSQGSSCSECCPDNGGLRNTICAGTPCRSGRSDFYDLTFRASGDRCQDAAGCCNGGTCRALQYCA